MNKTKIEWVRNPPPPHIKVDGTGRWHDPTGKFTEQPGYTWNPITGCLNGCEYCYARKLAYGRLKTRYLANNNLAPLIGEGAIPYHTARLLDALDPFYPRFWEERLDEFTPYNHEKKPKGIFVCDMGELFGDWIPQNWINRIWACIVDHPEHRFYLLTKQPQNLPQFSPFPENCWVGVTVTSVEYMADAVANLACTKAKVKFMSFEPLLGSVMPEGLINFLDWVIIGAQTKPTVYPKLEWVEEIVKACDKAGIPVFLKDNLEPMLLQHPYSDLLWENLAQLRQEMPR